MIDERAPAGSSARPRCACPSRPGAADIGYWIAPGGPRQRATPPRRPTRWPAGPTRTRCIASRCGSTSRNLVSARVALRAGFGYEGLRRDALCTDGRRHDTAIFVRTADDPGDPIAPAFPPLPAGGLTDGVLTLREPVPDDLTAFAEQENDPLTRQVVFTAEPRPTGQRWCGCWPARAWTGWSGPRRSSRMVDVETGRFAGSLHLRGSGPPNVAGIGYAVHPDFRGRGYTTRALRLVADWAFAQAGFVRLELGAKQHNVASQRAAAAAGFQPDGMAAARLRNADGTFSDEVRFALVHPRT